MITEVSKQTEIGKEITREFDGLVVKVKIVDMRTVWGRDQYYVTAGHNNRWINK